MPVVIPQGNQRERVAVPQNRSAGRFAGKAATVAASHQKSEAPGRKKPSKKSFKISWLCRMQKLFMKKVELKKSKAI